jgi:predicted SAM-dependent methyltransferase
MWTTLPRGLARRLLGKRTRRAIAFDWLRLKARARTLARRPAPSPPSRLLHLGCGGRRVPGFLNVDVAGSDLDIDLGGGVLPWADGTFTAIASQQVIEHLEIDTELRPLLAEMARVLAPGGEAWLACPDMEAICRSYLADGGAALLRDRQSRWPEFDLGGLPESHMMNVLFHQAGEHVNLFDFRLLAHVVREAGFSAVERVHEADFNARFPGFPVRNDDGLSLYVRAVK